jgi:hypothetical protein
MMGTILFIVYDIVSHIERKIIFFFFFFLNLKLVKNSAM